MRAPRWLLRGLLVVAVLLAVAQLLPFGRVENPPVTAEPAWDSPRTRELVARACFDCHSNQSKRQWYHLAPVSWLVAYDVAEAREHLNFSDAERAELVRGLQATLGEHGAGEAGDRDGGQHGRGRGRGGREGG